MVVQNQKLKRKLGPRGRFHKFAELKIIIYFVYYSAGGVSRKLDHINYYS